MAFPMKGKPPMMGGKAKKKNPFGPKPGMAMKPKAPPPPPMDDDADDAAPSGSGRAMMAGGLTRKQPMGGNY